MRFFRHVLGTFATEIFTVGVNFAVGVLLARLLPVSERGVLALVMLLPVTLAYFADLGISQSVIYLIGREKKSPAAVAANSLVWAALLGSGCALAAWLLRGSLLRPFLKDIPDSDLALVLALLPVLMLDNYWLSILRAEQRFGLFNLRRALSPLLLGVGVVLLSGLAGWGVRGAVLAFVAASLVGFAVTWVLVQRGLAAPLRLHLGLARQTATYGVKSYVQNLVGHLHYRLDIYLLALFLPPAQVAFYAVATSVAEFAFYIPDSVGTVLFPRLSAETEERIHTLTAEVARHTVFVTALVSVTLLFAGVVLIPLVYGPDYRPAVLPFVLLLPGILAMAVFKVLTRNFSSRNRQQVSILAAVVALVCNTGLNLAAIPRWGVAGAALASLVSYTISAALLTAVFHRQTGISLSDILLVRRSDLSRYTQLLSEAGRRFPFRMVPAFPAAGNASLPLAEDAPGELAEGVKVRSSK